MRDANELTRHVLAPIDLHDGADDTLNHKVAGEVLENVMRGSYAYVGADGLPYMIDWFADDEGFHPSAPHPSNYVELVSDHAGDVVDTKVDTAEAEFQSSEDILSDESSFDEVFSISGNDFPAYADQIDYSQLQYKSHLEALNE